MTEGDIYETVETYSRQGKVPAYKEAFIDEGDVNVLRVSSGTGQSPAATSSM